MELGIKGFFWVICLSPSHHVDEPRAGAGQLLVGDPAEPDAGAGPGRSRLLLWQELLLLNGGLLQLELLADDVGERLLPACRCPAGDVVGCDLRAASIRRPAQLLAVLLRRLVVLLQLPPPLFPLQAALLGFIGAFLLPLLVHHLHLDLVHRDAQQPTSLVIEEFDQMPDILQHLLLPMDLL